MANIVQGVPLGSSYTDPPTAGGGVAIYATPYRELLTSDLTQIELLRMQAELLLNIWTELMITNENMFPGVNFEQERITHDDPLETSGH